MSALRLAALAVLCAACLACTSTAKTPPADSPAPPAPPPEMQSGKGTPDRGTQELKGEGFSEPSLKGRDGLSDTAPGSAVERDTPDGPKLETVFFAYDQDDLGAEALAALARNANWMKEHPRARLTVEGYCDERGSLEYNLNLGSRRANAVKAHLVRLGVDAARLETISYGEEKPADAGHDETAWSRNRRAEFQVLGK